MLLFFGLLFGLIALLLLGGSLITIYRQQRKRSRTAETRGTVVDLERRILQAGSPGIYCPVVEFTPPCGEKVRFVSEFGSLPASHRVGQTVKIRYDPLDPTKTEVDSTAARWLVPAIMIATGVIFCCFSVFALVVYYLLPALNGS